MCDLKKRFLTRVYKFQTSEYRIILDEFQQLLAENRISVEERPSVALWCLNAVNLTAKRNLNSTIEPKHFIDLYFLSKLCCDLISEKWVPTEQKFATSLFYICKTLLSQKYIDEACEIGQFVFRYFDEREDARVNFNEKEVNVPLSLVALFLNTSNSLSINSEERNKLFHLWNIILKSSNTRIFQANFLKVIEYFSTFLQKVTKENFLEYHEEFVTMIKMLSFGISAGKDVENLFFKFLRSTIYKICEFSTVEKHGFFLDTFNQIKNSNSMAIEFCENIYKICMGLRKNNDTSDLISGSYNQLKVLIENENLFLNDAIYCSAIILAKIQLDAISKDLNGTLAHKWLTILLTLARRLLCIDINELFCGKNNGMKKIDSGTAVLILTDIMSLCTTIKDLDLANKEIFNTVMEAERLTISCVMSTDEKRKEQAQHFLSVNGVNMCRAYMMANLHHQCIELARNLLQYYSTLTDLVTYNPKFKLYITKLITCLCTNYRSLEMYEEWLITASYWSIILPPVASISIHQYCYAKHKLCSYDSESNLLNYTFRELMKMKIKNKEWEHVNLKKIDLMQICFMELKGYLTNNLILPEPIMKLIGWLERSNSLNEIVLGVLQYAKFRVKLSDFRKENKSEFNALTSCKIDPKNKEDDYVLLGYNFHKQKKIMKYLDAAINSWSKAAKKAINSESVDAYVNELELTYVKEAALIYKQFCETSKEIEVWKLLYNLSKNIRNEVMMTFAFSNLMCTTWKLNLKWKTEVERTLSGLNEDLKLRYQLDYFTRCLVKGFTLEEKKSLKEMSLEKIEEHNLLSKYYFLMAQCYFNKIFENNADPFAFSYKGIINTTEMLKNIKWNNFAESCELQCILLDVSIFLVTRCTEKFEFHNARNFTEEPLKICQILALPLRSCQFLNISAFLDAITGNLESSYVKLQYSSSILNHQNNLSVKKNVGFEPSNSIASSNDLRFLSNNYDVDFEENPNLHSELQFEMPEFAEHDKKCECDICINGEYLKLYCELMLQYGIYFRILEKWSQADEFFQGLFKLLRIVKKRIDIVELKTLTLIQCGNYWAAKNRFQEAMMCNRKAYKAFESVNVVNQALKIACEDQHWQLFGVKLHEEMEKLQIGKEHRRGVPRLEFLERAEAVRTPNVLKGASAQLPITPCARKSRKVLLFDDFSKSPEKSSNKKEFHTPPDIVMELPSTAQKRRTRIQTRASKK